MSIPFYSNIDMKNNTIENAKKSDTADGLYSSVIGGWHMYSDGENLTNEGFTIEDYNNIKVGTIITYPSSVDSSATVTDTVVYVSHGEGYKTAGGRFVYKTFKLGSEGLYEMSCDSMDTCIVYKGLNLNESSSSGGVACFTEDTLILTEHGLKPIIDINLGDKIYSKGNEVELKEVDKIISHITDDIYEIDLGNTKIKASWSHPFYVVGKGPVLAKDLKKFDNLITINDSIVIINDINIINIPTEVYEIRIKDNHNYFVGENKIFVYNEESIIKED